MYTTLVLISSAPSFECASFSVISSKGIVTRNITNKSAWEVESDSHRFRNGVLGSVMGNSLHWNTVYCSYAPAFVVSRSCLSETMLSSTRRKPFMGTWGKCKPFLFSWYCTIVALKWDSYRFNDGMFGLPMEYPPYRSSVNCFYNHGFVISRSWMKLSETTLSSTARKPFVGTWGYCKPFLCSWCCTIVAVESDFYMFKYGMLEPVMEDPLHGSTVNCSFVHAFVMSRSWLKFIEITLSGALRKPNVATWGYCTPFLCSWCCTIDAPSVECTSLTVINCEERVPKNIRGSAAFDIKLESFRLKYGVLELVMEYLVHGSTVNCCSVHAVIISCARLGIIEVFLSTIIRKPPKGTPGHCKLFLFSWSSTISAPSDECASFSVISCQERVTRNITDSSAQDESNSYCFTNTVLLQVKEHSVPEGTVNSFSDHAVVISRLWQPISEILPSSIPRKLALATWGYCKPFLCPWRCNFVSLCKVELKNTELEPVKEHSMHRGTSDILLFLPDIYEQGSKLFWFTLRLIATWDYLSYVICQPKYILVSFLSFGLMFTLTSYLVVLTLKLNRKRVRCRVNSCI